MSKQVDYCAAGKHDLNVVGTKRRYDRGPDAKPDCRGCFNDRRRRRRAAMRAAEQRSWELAEVYDLETGALIVDEVAIDRAVAGGRIWTQERTGIVPWITETEATIAARLMAAKGYEPDWIADNIGCAPGDVTQWLLADILASVAA